MNPERTRRHRITLSEIITHTVHGSRIPNLIRPVISGEFTPDPQYAGEFSSAFLFVLLIEGDTALDYVRNLPATDREKVLKVLESGGIGDTEFVPYNKGGDPKIRNIIENSKLSE